MIRDISTLSSGDKIDVPCVVHTIRTATITEIFDDGTALVKFEDMYGHELKILTTEELENSNYIG